MKETTILRTLFRSERCFSLQHKRGDILASKAYLLCYYSLFSITVLTVCISSPPAMAVYVKFLYEIMLNRNFQRFFKICGMFVSYVAPLVRQKEKLALE